MFEYPQSLALDGSGNVFVTNELGNSVSELMADSGYATGLNFAPRAQRSTIPSRWRWTEPATSLCQ